MTAESLVEDTPEKRVWLKHLYFITRILVIIAIIGMIITSIVVIITGFAELVRIITFLLEEGIFSEPAGRFLSVAVTEMIDLYLIGLVLIIFASASTSSLSTVLSISPSGWISLHSMSSRGVF